MSPDELTALLFAEGVDWRVHALGGRSATIEVEGVKVFVKMIALADIEQAAEGSTANLFGLPLFYQYGVGSAGFGAWRELAACAKAGAWALSGECPFFPLLYHWRVAPDTPRPSLAPEQQAWIDQSPAYWDHSDAVRARLEAIAAASASIVLFLEHIPAPLGAWLASRPVDEALEAVILRLDDQLRDAAAFMNARGMLHFDLHSHNVLTDGEQVYVADFGLAISSDFDLSPAERAFFEAHRLYDRSYLDWSFHGWLPPETDRGALPPALRARLDRATPVGLIMAAFFKTLREESKSTPYPAAALEAAVG